MDNSNYLEHTFVVILCGGGGTRVWPLSVKHKPKQFLNFYSDKTLYQETVARAQLLVPSERILVITNQQYEEEIKKQSPEIPCENIIAEPMKKNTAMAMGVVAAYAKKYDPQAVLVNLASDHVVGDLDIFVKTLKVAAQVAFEDKNLVAVGIEPTFAHPGLGYIHVGEEANVVDGLPVCRAAGFKEKPSVEVAKEYLASKQYLWNANNYVWRADSLLEAFDTLSPEIAEKIHKVEQAFSFPKETEIEEIKQAYVEVLEAPIDTAISEKASNLFVISGKFSWQDIGSWEVVYDLGQKDPDGNVIVKNHESIKESIALMFDAKNNLIHYNSQPVAIVGLNDIIVVDTGSGLLICDKKRSNEVKKVVEALAAKGLEQYL